MRTLSPERLSAQLSVFSEVCCLTQREAFSFTKETSYGLFRPEKFEKAGKEES